ncbi:unnamed protein product [Clavelina lepadiformis]|uniref:MRH domain-containing protein n=1 Tax=Clavelina lepadiformis TaxID=159417 RepID=A0ABP0F2K4_CLALP
MYGKAKVIFIIVIISKTFAETFQDCGNVRGKNFSQLSGVWEARSELDSNEIYLIDICQSLSNPSACSGSAICKTSGDITSYGDHDKAPEVKASSENSVSFYLEYNTTKLCEKNDQGSFFYRSSITFDCSKKLGAPVLITSSANSSCSVDFLWETSLACLPTDHDAMKEVQCYKYDHEGHRRDLESLIRRAGGYFVKDPTQTTSSLDGVYINVCRDIQTVEGDEMHEALGQCPQGAAACLVKGSHVYNLGVPSSPINITQEDRMELEYVAPADAEKPDGCSTAKVIITFVCPGKNRGGSKSPFITSSLNCQYNIEWWTEAACPSEFITSKTCGLDLEKHGVQLDLTPLMKNSGVYSIQSSDSNADFGLNVCANTNIQCGPKDDSVHPNAVCQIAGTSSYIAGVADDYRLKYVDEQLSLVYVGGQKCHNGIRRSSVIFFHCNQTAGVGQPTFNHELHCTYFFDWHTSHACIASAPTCQITDKKGQSYDLSSLKKIAGEGVNNWQVLNSGEQQSNTAPLRYFINICGEVLRSGDTRDCPVGSSVCSVQGTDFSSFGSFSTSSLLFKNNKLELHYNGGKTCGSGKQASTKIIFECKLGDLDGSPTVKYLSADKCDLVLTWHTAAACPLKTVIGENCMVSDKDSGLTIDLKRLTKTGDTGYYKVTSTNYDYYLNVCGELSGTPGAMCVDHARHSSACQHELHGLQRTYTTGVNSGELTYYNGFVRLLYKNGDSYSNHLHTRSTQISFLCDPKAGAGHPAFMKEGNATYVFNWYTSYVCPAASTQCVVEDKTTGDQYDLSSLAKSEDVNDVNWSVIGEDVPGQGKRKYYLNICRPVNEVQAFSNRDIGCDVAAGACETVISSNGQEDVSVANLGKPVSGPRIERKGHLILTYTNGSDCTENGNKGEFTTHMHFICQKGASATSPRVIQRTACTVSFEWSTQAACAIVQSSSWNSTVCEVKDRNSEHVFNLLPLRAKAGHTYVVTNNNYNYIFNICGTVEKCQDSHHDQAFACKEDPSSHDVNQVMETSVGPTYSEDGHLTMEFTTALRDPKSLVSPKYIVTFTCNRSVIIGKPTLTSAEEDVTRFDFPTSLACQPQAVNCLVSDEFGNEYDLSPLSNPDHPWSVVDEANSNNFHLSVCKPLSSESGCSGGLIGACKTVTDPDGKSTSYSLGLIQSNPQAVSDGLLASAISISYMGGDICQADKKKRYSTRILFQCSDSESSAPVLQSNSDSCEFFFVWRTSIACPVTKSESKPGQSCSVTEPLYQLTYDLSSLTKSTDYHIETGDEWDFNLNVCGKLRQGSDSCKDAAACQVHHSSTQVHDAGHPNSTLSYKDGIVTLTYLHGQRCHHDQYDRSTTIRFRCHHNEQSKPTYINETADCTYVFDWPTPKVCPPIKFVECLTQDSSGNQYDLSSLSLADQNYMASLKGDTGGHLFYINVCRTLLHKPGVTCPPDAATCVKLPSNNKFVSLGKVDSGPHFVNNKLQLVYSNGDPCSIDTSRNYSTTITFQCDASAPVNSLPVVVSGDHSCNVQMTWVTRAACPLKKQHTGETSSCTAVNPNTRHEFNMSALASDTYHEVHAPDGRIFHINICKDVTDSSCPDGHNGNCMRKSASWHSAGVVSSQLMYTAGALKLVYENGAQCESDSSRRYSTVISFVCKRSTAAYLEEPSTSAVKPVFVGGDDCTFYFSWHVHAACELQHPCAVVDTSSAWPRIIDMTPLISESGHYVAVSDIAGEKASYFINVCRPLEPIQGVACPAGAAVCEVTESHKTKSLGFVDPQHNFLSFNSETKSVTLQYNSNQRCPSSSGHNVSSQVIFSCRRGASPQASAPRLVSITSDCLHIFEWGTDILCSNSINTTASTKCSFTNAATEETYDLSKISSITLRDDGGNFEISPCGQVQTSKNKCRNSAACFTSSDGEKVSLGDFSTRAITAGATPSIPVQMTFTGGDTCPNSNRKRHIDILFRCNHNTTSTANNIQIVYDKLEQCSYIVYWPTPYVCPGLSESCVVSDVNSGYTYDLSLLSSLTHAWEFKDNSGNTYFINLCRSAKSSSSSSCSDNSAVCRIMKDSQKVQTLGVLTSQMIKVTSSGVTVTYSGGEKQVCDNDALSSSTVITLQCDPRVTQLPQFVSLSQDECTFHITWKSRIACRDQTKAVTLDNQGKFVDPKSGVTVDLTPLLSRTWLASGDIRQEKGGISNYKYAINLKGKIDTSELSSSVGQSCGTGTAVCQYKAGFARKIAEISPKTPSYVMADEILEVNLTSNDKCGKDPNKKSHVIISIRCSHYNGIGKPEFVYESNECGYIFHWYTDVICVEVQGNEKLPSNAQNTSHPPSAVDKNTHEANDRHNHASAIVISVFVVLAVFLALGLLFRKAERRQALVTSAKRIACAPCRSGDDFQYRYVSRDGDLNGEEGTSLFDDDILQEETSLLGNSLRLHSSTLSHGLDGTLATFGGAMDDDDDVKQLFDVPEVKVKRHSKKKTSKDKTSKRLKSKSPNPFENDSSLLIPGSRRAPGVGGEVVTSYHDDDDDDMLDG